MTALWHRERTGEGQLIEIAQAENAAPMFTQAIMDYSLNGVVQSAIGNRDVHGAFPCGVYPAKSPGTAETMEDHWVSIHVQSDAEWLAFVQAMGNPSWAADPRFAANAGRAEHFREIDRHIAEFTRDKDDYDLMHLLQGAGIAADPCSKLRACSMTPSCVRATFSASNLSKARKGRTNTSAPCGSSRRRRSSSANRP